uniref:Acyl-CoA dehydrogenase NM domain-like protein n=1 Tax=Moniliophthora roreri TaxID=221103 RepID=A0A0W0G6J1_MONRR
MHFPLPQDYHCYVPEELSVEERIAISHRRAKAIALHYSLTLEDVLKPSERFWSMYTDMIITLDGGAITLFSIQLNLAAGTLAPFVASRPELQHLMDDILAFRVSAQFLLTEVGHGIDALNLETTATLRKDGSFDIHSPNPQSAKYMPPTLPAGGLPRVGIVFCRLLTDDGDQGIRPFVVPLNDGTEMCSGVAARELPTRSGSKAVGHAITSFEHVIVPATSLLGEIKDARPAKVQFFDSIWRVSIGSMSLAGMVAPGLKMAAYIAAKYSQRRKVTNLDGTLVPILSFRTQQLPILHALAQGFVLNAFYERACSWVSECHQKDCSLRIAIATIVKATMVGHWRRTGCIIADRCGAQSTFDANQLLPMEMEMRGVAIAEGDVLVLCVRLAFELAMQRCSIPPSTRPSDLASHEQGLLNEFRAAMINRGRSRDELNNHLLPRCLPLIEAIGHRMAYESAVDRGVSSDLLRLYEVGVVGINLPWYMDHTTWTRDSHFEAERQALDDVFGNIHDHLENTGAEPYARAVMLSDSSWSSFVNSLKIYTGAATYTPFNIPARL